MAEKLMMIALSPTMTEGTIARWKKSEGQGFSPGDLLCEVETDKASMDYEAPKQAVLLKILVQEGGKAAVGDTIAVIGKAGEAIPPSLLEYPDASKAAEAPVTAPVTTPAPPPAQLAAPASAPKGAFASATVPHIEARNPVAPAGYPPSSPLARKVALELGVDLRQVKGRGPEGRVTEKDVKAFAAQGGSPPPVPQKARQREISKRAIGTKRAIIAKRLGASFFNAPHYYLKKEILAEAMVEARKRINKGREKPISLNAILIKISAMALTRHPEINVFWREDYLEERSSIDIGLAVALPDGLITPVVRDCDLKGIEAIDLELGALIEKAKTKGLSPEEYEGAGFTITNLGSYGVDEFTAIINPPGSAILAVGALRKKPWVDDADQIVVARTLSLTLGCDHRSIDGAVGAAFLAELAAIAEDPFRALL